eukprot:CAMPEP_0174927836 /NCGR_PEP_ID=MMETSP1355-20121228/21401_1 /TAXON_ID=464990 /ORGANISM="Hemiselmis tepida, Strain CCMP443" /LENGTH=79 /DNA_ID=CAMNT_0016173967 /DNA_START=57 /DNA_END=293 /DNA_ORIENTATION=+
MSAFLAAAEGHGRSGASAGSAEAGSLGRGCERGVDSAGSGNPLAPLTALIRAIRCSSSSAPLTLTPATPAPAALAPSRG